VDEAAQGRGPEQERAAQARRRPERLVQADVDQGGGLRRHGQGLRSGERQRRSSGERWQIYYAARPDILKLAGVDALDSGRFTQSLLIDFMNERPEQCADWNVVFSDRGHFTEPHTGREVGLGTLAVRGYVESYSKPELVEGSFAGPHVDTHGPEGRFGGIVYIEKEGFEPLFEQARIAERFDLAIMSCKGMCVTAARELVGKASFASGQ
jgi:hypothetical protein